MSAFMTSPVIIGDGAAQAARRYIFENFDACDNVLVVCDTNTEAIAISELPGADRHVFPGDVIADPEVALPLDERAANVKALVAVGAGTVHDLTRYCAHKLGLPFVSFPTAASVDGFVSGIAAMTVGGQKLSFPSIPPVALFAEPAVFMSAPQALTAAGVGDMLGKYISLFDWEVSTAVTGERFDAEIYALERDALDRLVAAEPGSPDFGVLLMQALVTSGLAIQAYGNSRPASGSEHHLSHLWEMHCINEPVPALHGEKVGVATLLLLGRYRAMERFRLKKNVYEWEYLLPVFGHLTDGIIRENLPDPLEGLTQERLDRLAPILRKIVSGLPDPDFVKSYMYGCGCKTAVASLGLPDTPEFIGLTLEFAPYVRRRVTMLKLCGIC
jgi:glycerol-1-phosphate dehydrogenase [NAD(P)+]